MNKNEIALAAFEYNFARISDKIAKVVRAKKDACDRLIAFANFYLDNFAEITKYGGCPILNAAVDSNNTHKFLKDQVLRAIDIWLDNVSRIIYSGLKRNQIKRGVKAEQFASVFVSLIEGGLMLSKVTGNTIHLSRNVNHIIYLVNTELRV